ncbi:CRISPR-associated endoribonuclease Cas2 [Synergistales bacterium]|nr:CRISPR-associated endoribonuclease Cas2 [Synergistales bacterium]
MRLLVMYDLPMMTKENKRVYQHFRKFLISDGYDMLQFSIYCRIVNGADGVDKHLKRLQQNLPTKGAVRFMQITERQFQGIKLLVGTKKRKEKDIDSRQLLLF